MESVRGHNEGTIYFRADRRAQVAAVTLPSGRRLTEMCPHRNHDPDDPDCKPSVAALARLLEQRDTRRGDPRRVRVGAFLTRWASELSTETMAPATIRAHRSIVKNHLVPALGGYSLAALGPSDVDAYLRAARNVRPPKKGAEPRNAPLDGRTKSHIRATLRRALQDAVREGLLDRNVAALAHAPALAHRERPTLTAAQVAQLLEGTRGDRYHALYALGAVCGLRMGEALGLRWSALNLDAGTLAVRESLTRDLDGRLKRKAPKTLKGRRTILLPSIVVDALRAHRELAKADLGERPEPMEWLVFLTPDGRTIHGSNVLPVFYRTLDRLKLPRVHFHDLRHSAATILYKLGVPIETIADILGHSSTRITADLYRHRSAELQREAVDRMAAALRAASPPRSATSEAGGAADA